MTTPREVAEAYWAAECRRDIEAIMAHYHQDATYQDAGGLLRGHPAIRGFYEKSAREYPGLEVRILREYVGSPESSALEVQAILIDPAGRRYRIQGLIAITVRDGRIVSLRCYEDPPIPA